MRKAPDISRKQALLHLLLFLCGIFCALFMHGDKTIMLIAGGSAITCFFLSLIPRHILPNILWQGLQLVVIALALTWAQQAHSTRPIDIFLVEIGAFLGSALLLGRTRHDHSLLFFISIGFVGYGGLMPLRPFFIPVFILSILLILLILYTGFSLNANEDNTLPRNDSQPRQSVVPWQSCVLHACGTLAIIFAMIHFFPQARSFRQKGLIPVSFQTQQTALFPKTWDKWLQPKSQESGGSAVNTSRQQDSATEHVSPTAPVQIDSNAAKLINAANQPAFNARNGSGAGATIGTGLVFRARSTAKLYWVMQMYDTYDGTQWTASRMMSSGQSGPDTYTPVNQVEVPQYITMEAPPSTMLPHQFRGRKCVIVEQQTNGPSLNLPVHPRTPYSFIYPAKHLPAPPWTYQVQSFVPTPDSRKPSLAWQESQRNFGWNYRSLPRNLISQRLALLAHDLTKDVGSPYEKALKLRDYLRTNFTYSIQTPAIPNDKEVVDFFLFESKQGYCQHFAQALAVLARLAGLHSRLVTGYLPGDFNLLSNTFEVYEYHAHAWTQIFIEPYGWLTFDGVAPGNLDFNNKNTFFNALNDPFGEDWKAHPPELSFIPQPSPEQSMVEPDPAQINPNDFSEKVYQKAMQDGKTAQPDTIDMAQAAAKLSWQTLVAKARILWNAVISILIGAAHSVTAATMRFLNAIVLAKPSRTITVLILLALCTLLFTLRRRIHRKLRFLCQLRACLNACSHLKHGDGTRDEQVRNCYASATTLLKLADIQRPPARDMNEWALLLEPQSPDIAACLLPIAQANTALQFTDTPVAAEDAAKAVRALEQLKTLLMPSIKQQLKRF